MSLVLTGLLVLQVVSALTIVVLVLLQQGKGSDMGSAFGGGSSGSLFGAAGAANFLSRMTKWAAVLFFATTLGLAYVSHTGSRPEAPVGVMEGYQDPSVPVVPGGASDASVPATPAGNDVPQAPAAPATPAPAAPAPAAPAATTPEASSAPQAPAEAAEPAPAEPASQAPAATDGKTPAPGEGESVSGEKPVQENAAEPNNS